MNLIEYAKLTGSISSTALSPYVTGFIDKVVADGDFQSVIDSIHDRTELKRVHDFACVLGNQAAKLGFTDLSGEADVLRDACKLRGADLG